MTDDEREAFRENIAIVHAHMDTERFAQHAQKLALAVAKRMGAPNVNWDLEIRREILWLKRKLPELQRTLEPYR